MEAPLRGPFLLVGFVDGAGTADVLVDGGGVAFVGDVTGAADAGIELYAGEYFG